ncbi:Hypothetical protein CINCED_3A014325 [Cinara cedri]|uniref:Retrotransposon gag domain n=1 Tax=Cinara cedri TaxID=506608 RepID=A0A5E4MC61_9HEMI|nr:Hypothetical protein CINCED_3A014325 [Cinara cedri]
MSMGNELSDPILNSGVCHTHTYSELHSLVSKIRDQVQVLTYIINISSKELEVLDGLSNTTMGPKPRIREFRVMPKLNTSITYFTGRETPQQAENWLSDVKGIASANEWPINTRLHFVRTNLRAAARDWFSDRNFMDWSDFELRFRTTFILNTNTLDRYDLLKARVQKENECVMDYFPSKVRMCRQLALPFVETKDQLLKGLFWHDMALYALGRVHQSKKELLRDLLKCERRKSTHSRRFMCIVNKTRMPGQTIVPKTYGKMRTRSCQRMGQISARVIESDAPKKSWFAIMARVIQLKSWQLDSEYGEEMELEENSDESGEEDETTLCRPIRLRRPPSWRRDYI